MRCKRTNFFVFAVFVTALLCPAESNAQHYCAHSSSGWPTDEIPVVIHENLVAGLCLNPGSTCSTITDIERRVRAVLAEYYNSTGSPLRLYFDEVLDSGEALPGEHVYGKIHVWAGDCVGDRLGEATVSYASFGLHWGSIKMCRTNDNGLIAWRALQEPSGAGRGFHDVLLHEIGHVLGLNHPGDSDAEHYNGVPCNQHVSAGVGATIMTAGYPHFSSNLMAADREFIRDTYGQRSNVGRRQASVDGLTWSAGANGPSQISTAVGRFAASNSRLGSRTWVAAINQSNKIFVTRFVLGGSWTFITELPHVVYYHPGIASSSSTALSVAYQVHLSWANGFTDIKKRTSSNEGSTWGTPVAIKDGSGVEFGTAAPGVAHTYNPDTATYITMARGTGFGGPSINRAMYQSGSSAWDQFLDVISSDTPAIACGSAVTLGTRNCLIAWTDGTSWTGTIKWKQCQMTTGSFSNCSAIRSLGYFGVGSASVAYVGNNNGYPWQIAISQGGASVYTWRKQPADTASFQDQRSFSYSPQAILPAVGSLAESGVDHRYVFTMDD